MRAALFAWVISSTALLYAQNARVEAVGKNPTVAKFAAGGSVHMHLCSSGIDLVGKDDDALRVSYDSMRGNNVRVRIKVSGDQADLKVSGCPQNNFRVTVEVPKKSGLYVRMFAGELNVRDITGDKDVELHFGQLNMEVGKPDDYAHVHASVNSGELDAFAFNVDKGGLFRSFDHDGPGQYRVQAHVGAGELDLR
jgi:hypothetical protein